MIYALSRGERLESKGKKKSTSINRKITFGLVYFATTVKVQNFKKNHRKSKTLFPFSHSPRQKKNPTIFFPYLPLCKCQPGLNAGGPSRIVHIAPFLPFLSNRNATDSGDKASAGRHLALRAATWAALGRAGKRAHLSPTSAALAGRVLRKRPPVPSPLPPATASRMTSACRQAAPALRPGLPRVR